MYFKIPLFISIAALLSFRLIGQSPLNNSLGNCIHVKSVNSEFTFITDNGNAKVIVYSPNIIRIRVVKENFLKDFSYAVITSPVKCNIKFYQTNDSYLIETDSIILKALKRPLRFLFYNKAGILINSDDLSFGTSWLGDESTTYKILHNNERFIGLGEHTGNLDRKGEVYINYNTDNPNYDNNSKSLYASIPFFIGLYNDQCYGVFLDNTSKTTFSFGAGNSRFISFTAESGEMDYYFIYHTSVHKIIESYTWLTGRISMPPIWSLGYQQCRWSYFPASDVLSTAQKFRERHIPADMIYLDIHYMDQYKLFTWDKERFPNPLQLINNLEDLSFHTTVIIDPGVKVEENYPVYQDGLKSGIFVKYPDGTYYEGQVWPGWCTFPDFTMPKAREWWAKWIKTYTDIGISGFWNDMNEIAVWGANVPQLLEFNWEGRKTSYKEAKNIYGFLMARSTFESAKNYLNGKRPFVLTRAGFAGLQRYSSIWTADNQATDDHMLLGIRLLNSMGLSGLCFSGMDIGGFSGNPTQYLYIRWMQIGAFFPLYRGHTSFNTKRNEPWVYGESAEDIVRRYIGFRYQLLPYLYSSFYESSKDGLPVMRSLAIDYPFDHHIYDSKYQQQFLSGSSILVVPVKSNEAIANIYLPEGKWFDLFTDETFDGHQSLFLETPIERIPLFVKAGSIIPMQRLIESTKEDAGDTLFIHIYKGSSTNSFEYYEDDGETYDYLNGSYYLRKILYQPSSNTIELDKKEGTFTSKYKCISLVFHGYSIPDLQGLRINSVSLQPTIQRFRFFTSNFKYPDFGPDDSKDLITVAFKNDNERILVTW